MQMNWTILLLTAIIPMVMGFIWYNPKVFGKSRMNATGLTEDKMKGANMALIFTLSYIFSFMFAMYLYAGVVIHQNHIYSIFANDQSTEATAYVKDFMDKYGNNFRTFKHGAFHGVLLGLLLILPVVATNAMFERRGFKYIAINVGYWTVCAALMGGMICAYA